MSGVKNLKIVALELCLGAMLLSGCNKENSNEIVLGNKDVVLNYETEVVSGTISYENLDKYARIITLEDDSIKEYRLVMKSITKTGGGRYPVYDWIRYIDLESGAVIIEYYDDEEIGYTVGENFTIVSEDNIAGYLMQENFVKKEYEIGEILTFYNEKIQPALIEKDKNIIEKFIDRWN